MGRLESLRAVDPVLTNIARGYKNAAFVGEVLFPFVPVDKEAGKVPQFGKEAFKVYNTERAIRAKSNRLSPEGISMIDFVLKEHDIEFPIDYREIDESKDIVNYEIYATETVTKIINLRIEKERADLAQNLNTYPSGNKITLEGNAKWTAKTTSDPIGNIETGKETIRSKIGIYPNVMLLGATAYNALKVHPAIIDLLKYSQKAILTEEILSQIFDMKVVVGRAVYASDGGTFNDIWADNCILAYIPEKNDNTERTPFEPSFSYTFRKKNNPVVDKWDESNGKLHIIRNTDIVAAKVVGAEAGYIINDTNA